MIVPRTRLVVIVGATLLPAAALAAFVPSATAAAIAVAVVIIAAVATDAFLCAGRLADVRVRLPEVVRMSKGRNGSIPVIIERQGSQPNDLRFALPLSTSITSQTEEMDTTLANSSSLVDVDCKPTKRGRYAIERCYLQTPSPLKLWSTRTAASVHCDLRVYPDLQKDRKSAAAFFLNRGHAGTHAQRQIGRGREFEKLREYNHSDSYDEIHWKATARRGRPITKVFQVERTQEIYVVIDASRLSGRDCSGEAIIERYLTAALVLGAAADRQGDHFGLVVYSDKVDRFIRARSGKKHYAACREALYNVEAKLVAPDIGELCNFLRVRLRRRALLLFLTELDDPVVAESFVRSIEPICRQHVVTATMLKAPGTAPIFAGAAKTVPEVYERLAGHLSWQKLMELGKSLRQRGIVFQQLEPKMLATGLIQGYRDVKLRQRL
jgi:uncharacterized protein (DUF58 family)